MYNNKHSLLEEMKILKISVENNGQYKQYLKKNANNKQSILYDCFKLKKRKNGENLYSENETKNEKEKKLREEKNIKKYINLQKLSNIDLIINSKKIENDKLENQFDLSKIFIERKFKKISNIKSKYKISNNILISYNNNSSNNELLIIGNNLLASNFENDGNKYKGENINNLSNDSKSVSIDKKNIFNNSKENSNEIKNIVCGNINNNNKKIEEINNENNIKKGYYICLICKEKNYVNYCLYCPECFGYDININKIICVNCYHREYKKHFYHSVYLLKIILYYDNNYKYICETFFDLISYKNWYTILDDFNIKNYKYEKEYHEMNNNEEIEKINNIKNIFKLYNLFYLKK